MSPVPALAERLGRGAPLLSAWCGLPEPAIAGALAREGFDAVTLDLQHGALSLDDAIRAIPLVAAAGKPALARVPVGDLASVSRLLDAGAAGVIAPMTNGVEDARRLVAFAKFPPLGERSWGPHGALALCGLDGPGYFAAANGMSVAFAMIETRAALDALEAILAVAGLDGVLVGPSDLSIALSDGRALDPVSPAVEEALVRVVAAARAAGKRCAAYAGSGERARALAAMGFDLVAVGSDAGYLREGARAAIAAARAAP